MNKSLRFCYFKRVYKGKRIPIFRCDFLKRNILTNLIVEFINIIEKWLNSLFTGRDVLT